MTILELEEALEELFPTGFRIEFNKKNRLVIHTDLFEDESGELVIEEDDCGTDMEEDFERYDESDDYD